MLSLGLGFKTGLTAQCGCVPPVILVLLRDAEREPHIHRERDFMETLSQIIVAGMGPRTAVGCRFVRPAFRCSLLTAMALDLQADSLTSFSLSCSAVKEMPGMKHVPVSSQQLS